MWRRNPIRKHRIPGLVSGMWCFLLGGTAAAQLPNSPAQELAPVFSPGGDTLFFVRDGHPRNKGLQDAWFSVRTAAGGWADARPFSLNTRFDDAVVAIRPEGIYLANQSSGRRSRPGLSLARFRDGRLEKPEPVPVPGLSAASGHIGFHLVADSLLLIAMPGPEREDDDLFISRKIQDTWQEPVLIHINSDGNDFAPFWHAPYLYFSSDRNGNADIYRSERLSDDWSEWSEPEPLTGLNTPAFEAYAAIHPGDNLLYFVRAAAGQSADLVTIPLAALLREPGLPAPSPDLAVSRTGTVYFPFNSADLLPEATERLERLAAHARDEHPAEIQIAGYADAVGESESNRTLSRKRAEAIRAFFLGQGIPDAILRVTAEGKEKAVVPSASPDTDRQPDRKAEIRFLK